MRMDLCAATNAVRSIAITQGEIILSRWGSLGTHLLKDRRDFATQVDLDVEDNIKRELRERFPGHGLSGEESTAENPESDFQWLIDPIDGTKYYADKSALFAVSIGLLRKGQPVLGVVYSPTSKQCFHAFKGGGAFLNEERLSGPRARVLRSCIINIDTPQTDTLSGAERELFDARLLRLYQQAYRVRALGIGSLSMCWVATGALDAYVDLTGYVKPQDVAAGRVLMTEAGLRVGFMQEEVGPNKLVAAAPELWSSLSSLLNVASPMVQLPAPSEFELRR